MLFKRILLIFLFFDCMLIACFSAAFLAKRFISNKDLNNTYDQIKYDAFEGKKINWKQLKKKNPEVIGWIKVEDTNINYPVVQGLSDTEYIHKDFNGNKVYGGCIFMGSKCKLGTSDNLLIFGHHMRNGSMFADMTKFKQSDFADRHMIYFYTPLKDYKLKVFSAYSKEEIPSLPVKFGSKKSKMKYINDIKKNSDISTKKIDYPDTIFTFITCSYEGENYRTYVHACEY